MTETEKSANEDIDIEIGLSSCLLGLSANLHLIGQIINKLAAKRITLEEKMIRNCLHELGSTIGMSVTSAHLKYLNEDAKTQPISVEVLNDLDKLNEEIGAVLSEFMKMANFNPNFLEQYYEYDFAAKLLYEHKFNERLQDIVEGTFLYSRE